ncbi:MAG: PDZ domain-containing protein [Pirellulaceae bacterium]|nr:PDZ domain-containing protein [Pirellulaceae bacterium]
MRGRSLLLVGLVLILSGARVFGQGEFRAGGGKIRPDQDSTRSSIYFKARVTRAAAARIATDNGERVESLNPNEEFVLLEVRGRSALLVVGGLPAAVEVASLEFGDPEPVPPGAANPATVARQRSAPRRWPPTLGIGALADGRDGLIVGGIEKGGLGESRGLQAGDRILQVNGVEVVTLDDYRVGAFRGEGTLQLAVRDSAGQVREIIIRAE